MQTQIPLNVLRFGHDAEKAVNARVIGRRDGIETLAANIHERGLIEPLIVKQPDADGIYFVSDGNRRLAALQMMYGETSEKAIECMVREVDADGAFEDSLTAAVLAHQLHPVDQYEAYAQLIERGATEDVLARRFGLTPREVKQVLALGGLSPKLRDAWRAGEITADVAKAFTLSPSHKAQDKLFASLSKSGAINSAWSVRRELGADNREIGKLVRFVGVEAYRARGGVVTEDLFGDNHVASDAELLQAMAAEKVEAVKSELLAEGWAWAAAEGELPNGAKWSWSKTTPKELAFEGDEADRRFAIFEAIGKLEDAEEISGNDYEDQMEALKDKLAALDSIVNRRSFSDRQKAKSGVIIVVDDGEIEFVFGVIRPEAEAKSKKAAASTGTNDGAGDIKPDEPAVSNALVHRLTVQLTTAASTALLQDPDLALSVLLAAFVGYDDMGAKVTVGGLGASKLDLFGTDREDFVENLARARKMTLQERLQLVALVAGASLDFQNQPLDDKEYRDGHGPLAICNALDPKALNAALRGAFDAKDYFASVNKATAIAAIREALGDDLARQQDKNGKAEIVKFALANVPETGWLPPQLRAAGYDGPPISKTAKREKPNKPAVVKPAKAAPAKKAAAAKKVPAKRSAPKKAAKKKGR